MFFQQLGAWFLSLLVVFGVGVNAGREYEPEEANPELKQKVTEHLDAIVDEMAGLADDLNTEAEKQMEEFRQSEFVRSVEDFFNNVKEIAENTAEDIRKRFGGDEAEEKAPAVPEEAPAETETAPEAAEEAPAETEAVPEAAEEAPAETENAPEAPAETEAAPEAAEEAPAETESAPAEGTEAAPEEVEQPTAPVETEGLPG